MASRKDKDTAKDAPTTADLGLDVGYLGTKVDPRPNEAYSLESGPDSPSAAEVNASVAEQRVDELEAATA